MFFAKFHYITHFKVIVCLKYNKQYILDYEIMSDEDNVGSVHEYEVATIKAAGLNAVE